MYMQKNTKKNTLGPKRHIWRHLGPFSSSWACVGRCGPSFWLLWACVGRPCTLLAAMDGRWLLWTVVGCCGWSLAAVDLSSPALAAVDLRWPSLAFVGCCGPSLWPLWASSRPKVGMWMWMW
jgi:hypothetical protein